MNTKPSTSRTTIAEQAKQASASDNFSGTQTEQVKTAISPTPSWRKPDPSQWRYDSRRQGKIKTS